MADILSAWSNLTKWHLDIEVEAIIVEIQYSLEKNFAVKCLILRNFTPPPVAYF